MDNKIYDTFIYETMNGQFMVSDPLEFDQVLVGGPFDTEEKAKEAFDAYVKENEITFIDDPSEIEVTEETLPWAELSDSENLKYFFESYKRTVDSGKPSQRAADHLKNYIDIIQVKSIKNEQ
jgi:hypothetical protein